MCTVLKKKKLEPVHVKHGKWISVLRAEYSRMSTINLDLIMQKGSRVVQIIIAQKLHIIYIFKR